jgi:hypothetical protein
MESVTEKTKEDIRNTFYNEYFERVAEGKKGLAGKLYRFGDKYSKDESWSWAVVGAAALFFMICSPPFTAALPFAIWAGGVVARGVSAVLAENAVLKDTGKALEKDIANGILVERYTVKLEKDIETLQTEVSLLKRANMAFAKAASRPAAATNTAAPVSLKPETPQN